MIDVHEIYSNLPALDKDEDADYRIPHPKQKNFSDKCNNDIDISLEENQLFTVSDFANIEQQFSDAEPLEEDMDFKINKKTKPDLKNNDDNYNIDDTTTDIESTLENLLGIKTGDTHTNEKQADNLRLESEFVVAQDMMKKLHFIYSSGMLYLFTYPGYEVLDDNELIARMKEIAPYELQNQKPSFWSNVLKHIKTTRTIHNSLDNISHPLDEIVFRNGCYNVYTKQFREALATDYITIYNHIDFNIGNAKEGKNIEAYFEYVSCGDKEFKKLLWTTLGAILAPTTKFKKFFYLYGERDTGKSIFGQIAQFIVGIENCANISIKDLSSKFSVAQLHGKMLNCCFDNPATTLKNLGNLKILTSGGSDTIEVEKKYGTHRKVRSDQIKLLFASNNRLRIDPQEDAESFRSRVILIPFTRQIPDYEKDFQLIDKIKSEKDYIIKKATKAYRKLLDNNFAFPSCKKAEELLNEWFPPNEQKIFSWFFTSDYIKPDAKAIVSCKHLYDVYEIYCTEHGYIPMCYNSFIQSARSLSYTSGYTNTGKWTIS